MKPSTTGPARSRLRRLLGLRRGMALALHAAGWLALLALALIYFAIGDHIWFTSVIAAWPAYLWGMALLPVALLPMLAGMWRRSVAQVVALLLFTLLAYPDAFAIGRDATPAAVARFNALRAERGSTGPQAIRLAVWNVASYRSSRQGVLAALAAEAPDIVFVQENLWHDHTLSGLDLRGTPWEEFEITEIIDHGILSRWPVRMLETVPPNQSWGRQLAAVTLPDGRNLVLCNVHMFFPAIIWRTVFRQPGPLQAADDHRFNQYAEHAFAIRRGLQRTQAAGLILAGDFNVRGGMPSLRTFDPLARDIWPEVGRGWGATYPANRPAITPVPPLARIDQCWVSDGITPVDARVVDSLESDHRMLVVDLIVE